MEPRQILARVEALKKRNHRLSLDLRLKSVQEAKKFLKDHSLVLWDNKAELPNLLDAILGRIANEKERNDGRPSETCLRWRVELLEDAELVECPFFRKLSTALHQDLWASATLFAWKNRKLAEEGGTVSREALKIMKYLSQEGAARTDEILKALRYNTPSLARLFHRAKRELQERLIVLITDDAASKGRGKETLTFWSSRMPKQVLARAEQTCESEARLKLLAATLDSCVLSDEKNIRRWFVWDSKDPMESVEELIAKKTLVRVQHQKQSWIIPRKLLK
jgi:hypothetical protein